MTMPLSSESAASYVHMAEQDSQQPFSPSGQSCAGSRDYTDRQSGRDAETESPLSSASTWSHVHTPEQDAPARPSRSPKSPKSVTFAESVSFPERLPSSGAHGGKLGPTAGGASCELCTLMLLVALALMAPAGQVIAHVIDFLFLYVGYSVVAFASGLASEQWAGRRGDWFASLSRHHEVPSVLGTSCEREASTPIFAQAR